MRVGLSTFTYAWEIGVPGHAPAEPLTALGLVRRAADLGVGLVQFADNLPLHRLSPTELDELETEALDLGVSLEVGTRGIGDHLHRYAELAQRFGSGFVRVVIDGPDDHPSPEQAAERLSEFEAGFRRRGVRLAIENHDRFSCGELAGLVVVLGDWTGICLDTVNSFGALEAPPTVVEQLGPLGLNLHLKDFVIRRHSHAMGFEIVGAPAGEGALDIPWLLDELAGNPNVRTAILELWTPPEQSVAATIATETAWAQSSLEYLRTIPALQFARP